MVTFQEAPAFIDSLLPKYSPLGGRGEGERRFDPWGSLLTKPHKLSSFNQNGMPPESSA